MTINYHLHFTLLISVIFHIQASAQSFEYLPYRIGEDWVIVDVNGERVSNKEIQHEIFPAFTDRIRFKKGEFYGYLNPQGEELIPPIYHTARDFNNAEQPLAQVKLNDRWLFIERNGELTKQKLQIGCGGGDFTHGGTWVNIFKGDNGKMGLKNSAGEIIPPTYKKIIFPGREGLFIVVDFDDKYGIVNSKGEVIHECQYDRIELVDKVYRFMYYKLYLNQKLGIMNSKGNILIQCKYDNLKFHSRYGFCFEAYEGDKKLGYIYKGKEYWED